MNIKEIQKQNGTTQTNGGRAINFQAYSENMFDIIKSDATLDWKKIIYDHHFKLGIFNAFDSPEQHTFVIAEILNGGFTAYKDIDVKDKIEEFTGIEVVSAKLRVYKNRGNYDNLSHNPMTMILNYMPADDERVILEIIYK